MEHIELGFLLLFIYSIPRKTEIHRYIHNSEIHLSLQSSIHSTLSVQSKFSLHIKKWSKLQLYTSNDKHNLHRSDNSSVTVIPNFKEQGLQLAKDL